MEPGSGIERSVITFDDIWIVGLLNFGSASFTVNGVLVPLQPISPTTVWEASLKRAECEG